MCQERVQKFITFDGQGFALDMADFFSEIKF